MNKKITFLKTCYYIGLVADLFAAILLLFPQVSKIIFNLQQLNLTSDYLYVSRIAASLMLGWALLLLWASFKPVERKGILLLTICPVIIGLFIASIIAVNSGFIKASSMLPIWIFYCLITPLYLYAYLLANKSNN